MEAMVLLQLGYGFTFEAVSETSLFLKHLRCWAIAQSMSCVAEGRCRNGT